MSNTPPETLESLLSTRHDCLRVLVDQPQSKRALVEQLDCSESTVERALKSLADAGLVEYAYADSNWRATSVGRCAVEEYNAYADRLRDLADAMPVLDALPRDSQLDATFIDGSESYESDPTVPDAIVRPMLDSAREATRIRALVPRALASVSLDFYSAARSGDDSEFECVLDPDLFERLRELFPTETDEAIVEDGVSLSTGPIPHTFGLWIADDQEAGVVVYDDTGIRGILINEDKQAIDWAHNEYTVVKSNAESVSS